MQRDLHPAFGEGRKGSPWSPNLGPAKVMTGCHTPLSRGAASGDSDAYVNCQGQLSSESSQLSLLPLAEAPGNKALERMSSAPEEEATAANGQEPGDGNKEALAGKSLLPDDDHDKHAEEHAKKPPLLQHSATFTSRKSKLEGGAGQVLLDRCIMHGC